MGKSSTVEHVREEILRLCYAGLDSHTLRIKVFDRLQRAIPYTAFWCGTTDPETLLFTGAVMEGIDHAAIPAFVSNELRGDDANTFAELARRKVPVSTLYAATRGELRRSPRFREILEPEGKAMSYAPPCARAPPSGEPCACIASCTPRTSTRRR